MITAMDGTDSSSDGSAESGAGLPLRMLRSPWLKHGFWNTLEHAITSAADAFTAMALVWVFTPETFSRISLAQAFVSASSLLFYSPETILTRDLIQWKKQGA